MCFSVKTLCEFGCDLEDNFESPAIFHGINDPNMLEVLLKFGKQDPNQLNPTGSTPLIEAVNSNNFKSVQMLIQYGANLDQMDLDHKTPLIHACSNDFQNMDILECLWYVLQLQWNFPSFLELTVAERS